MAVVSDDADMDTFPYSTNGGSQCYKAAALALLYHTPGFPEFMREAAEQLVLELELFTHTNPGDPERDMLSAPPKTLIEALQTLATPLAAFKAWDAGKRYIMRDAGPQADASEYIGTLFDAIDVVGADHDYWPHPATVVHTSTVFHDPKAQKEPSATTVRKPLVEFNAAGTLPFASVLKSHSDITDRGAVIRHRHSADADAVLVVYINEQYRPGGAHVMRRLLPAAIPTETVRDDDGNAFGLRAAVLRTPTPGSGGHYTFLRRVEGPGPHRWMLHDSAGPRSVRVPDVRALMASIHPRVCLYARL